MKRLMAWKIILPCQQHLTKNKPFDMDDTFKNILSSSRSPTCRSCSPTHGSCSLAHEIASPKLMCDNKTCITQIKLKLVYSTWQNHADLHKNHIGCRKTSLDRACQTVFSVLPVFAVLLQGILYIKANMVSVRLSVWTKIGQCLEDSSSHCPFLVELVTNRAGARHGRAARAAAVGGRCGVPFLLKKSLGKTGGPASNQTKKYIFKKILFIIEHIKKTRIFLKKKKEKRIKYIKIEKLKIDKIRIEKIKT